jgi:hypothetical protein
MENRDRELFTVAHKTLDWARLAALAAWEMGNPTREEEMDRDLRSPARQLRAVAHDLERALYPQAGVRSNGPAVTSNDPNPGGRGGD